MAHWKKGVSSAQEIILEVLIIYFEYILTRKKKQKYHSQLSNTFHMESG